MAKMRLGLLVLCAACLSGPLPLSVAATGPAGDGSGTPGTLATGLRTEARVAVSTSSLELRDDGDTALQQRRLLGQRAPGALETVVLMCDFSDSLMLGRWGEVPGDFPPPKQNEFFYDAHDSVYFQHLLWDVKDYFAAVSGNQFELRLTIRSRTHNLDEPMWHYGNHPDEGEQPVILARDVVAAFDDEIDFSLYDTVILIHAGAGEETDILGNSPEQIYSTYLDPGDFQRAYEDSVLDQPYLPSNDFPEGEGIVQVLVLPETEYQDSFGSFDGHFGSLGVYCFEVGLRLGMLSLSDFTPSGSPDSQGIGQFGLMGYGLFAASGWIPPQPCVFNKVLMGWIDPLRVSPDTAANQFLTPALHTIDAHAAIRVDITGQEYWLLSYRNQDPDGNRIFSFDAQQDSNGNNIPDFWDADSPTEDGRPWYGYSIFDPETDVKERLFDAEWDFYMSDNDGRAPGVKGAGSGVYIWHIDEGVIQRVFGLPYNLFNADPARKAVDLEEADSIQDLDSRVPSVYMLGGDDDSFRAEDTSLFSPATLPPTDTAGGAPTGVVFSDFSSVVLDSTAYTWINDAVTPPDTLQGFDYADTMFVNISRQMAPADMPEVGARATLPEGTDLRGSHLLAVDLDNTLGPEEIVFGGHAGEVFALDGDLREYIDRDGDPDTIEPLAVGTLAGEPVAWNLPPAVGDIDNDGAPEIVLTGPGGVWAFETDGTPVLVADATSHGLYHAVAEVNQPPILMAIDSTPNDLDCDIGILIDEGETARLLVVGGPAADLRGSVYLGSGRASAPAIGHRAAVHVAVVDTVLGQHRLVTCDLSEATPGYVSRSYPLPFAPGLLPPFWGEDYFHNDPYLIVVGEEGRAMTIFPRAGRSADIVWNDRIEIQGPLAAGHAVLAGGKLGRVSRSGAWQDGWPQSLQSGITVPEAAVSPTPLVTDDGGGTYYFTTTDGRIFALDAEGRQALSWPLAGPATVAGSPVLADFGIGGMRDLVAVGSFPSITGLDSDGAELTSSWVSELVLWRGVAAPGQDGWPMWGGNPWRNGGYQFDNISIPVEVDGGIVAGSHICYPNPLDTGPLFVRATCGNPGRARAVIHNLEGEQVSTSEWQNFAALEPFAIQIDLDRVASGIYLCRLVVEPEAGSAETSVVQFAVER